MVLKKNPRLSFTTTQSTICWSSDRINVSLAYQAVPIELTPVEGVLAVESGF